VIEYRRDLDEKCPRNPSMCTHRPISAYAPSGSAWLARSLTWLRIRRRWPEYPCSAVVSDADFVAYLAR
jgi:hypothetical protein